MDGQVGDRDGLESDELALGWSMTPDQQFGTFFLPGPTEVRCEVLAAMVKPMIPHRSTEFEELFRLLQQGLRALFFTSRPVFVAASSGTGMMEAGIRALPPGPILCTVNGAFSERFAHIAEMCGRRVDRYEVEWGATHDPDELDRYLSRGRYRAITVTHCETSTGALNEVRLLSDIAHSRGALCLVDSVSGLGGAELRFDEWKLDYVLTGSQKALALPPGLAFAAASQEFVELARTAEGRGVYFDIVEMNRFAEADQVPATPAFSLLYALEVQLKAILSEGMENRWERHSQMAAATDAWIADLKNRSADNLENIVAAGSRSPTVSTIRLPEGIEGKGFVQKVRARGIQVGGGYGKLGSTTFRIGHMGDHSVSTLQSCFAACERALRD